MATDQRQAGAELSTIANGASLGSAVRIGGHALVGLILDSAWDTNIITFNVSMDNVTYYPLYLDDANTEVQVAAAAAVHDRAISMNTVLDKLAVWNYVKPRSGTTAAAATQTGATVITFVLKA